MSRITMLGIDPGLNSLGYAIAEVDLASRRIIRVDALGLLTTRRDNTRKVRRSSDDYRRARSLVQRLRSLISGHDIRLAAAEMATTSPYSRPSLNFGMMIGILAGFDFALIEVLPQEVKQAITGRRSGDKTEIIRWALEVSAGDEVAWPTSTPNKLGLSFKGRPVALYAEHQADALAVIQTALSTDQIGEVIALQHALERP